MSLPSRTGSALILKTCRLGKRPSRLPDSTRQGCFGCNHLRPKTDPKYTASNGSELILPTNGRQVAGRNGRLSIPGSRNTATVVSSALRCAGAAVSQGSKIQIFLPDTRWIKSFA